MAEPSCSLLETRVSTILKGHILAHERAEVWRKLLQVDEILPESPELDQEIKEVAHDLPNQRVVKADTQRVSTHTPTYTRTSDLFHNPPPFLWCSLHFSYRRGCLSRPTQRPRFSKTRQCGPPLNAFSHTTASLTM